ncbi:MAG: putative metal-dependent hydrolase [Bacteroidia bacterium]|nr:putative metal-dependent hydrolase [Bacteroidia bacterium]
MKTIEELKYPIGQFIMPQVISNETLVICISDIAFFPTKITKELQNLNNTQLDTQYRPKGWSLRQVVNHCADSHMNSFIRIKLALTEKVPIIKPYFEERWAELSDSKSISLSASLKILEGVHERWVHLLKSLSEAELNKTFIHPASQKEFSIKETIVLYSWHCKHHLGHITQLKAAKNW